MVRVVGSRKRNSSFFSKIPRSSLSFCREFNFLPVVQEIPIPRFPLHVHLCHSDSPFSSPRTLVSFVKVRSRPTDVFARLRMREGYKYRKLCSDTSRDDETETVTLNETGCPTVVWTVFRTFSRTKMHERVRRREWSPVRDWSTSPLSTQWS